MSVYANTLNAYAAKLKAQRKAAEREAQLALRRKSQEQRIADKLRFEQAKAQKLQQEQEKKYSTFSVIDAVLDRTIHTFKEDYNVVLLAGERGKLHKDLNKLAGLFYYEGDGRMYIKVDASGYSKDAYSVMLTVLATMKVISEDAGFGAINENRRMIVVFKEDQKMSVAISQVNTPLDEIREFIAQNEHLRVEFA